MPTGPAPTVPSGDPLGVDPDELVATYPHLFHMAEARAWPSIRAHGLESAARLVARYGASPTLVSARRARGVELGDGAVTLRDNGVLDDGRLAACLVGVAPPEFYRMLNGRVYFWPSRHRVDRLLAARAYRARPHLVLTLDTAAVLARHGERVRLSPINMGTTLFTPPARGLHTATPLDAYPFAERRRRAGRRDAVAEVSVEDAVPDAAELVRSAVIHHPDGRRDVVV